MARAVVCAAAFAAGCSLLVPDTLPPYTCASASGCPDGMTCDIGSHTCVAPGADASIDTGTVDVATDSSTPDVVDAPADVTGPCTSLGCTCSGSVDCDSHICAENTTVTPALYNAVGHGFCTAPCCTSSDCPGGFVCFGTAAGGSYCVAPNLLGRSSTLGTTLGGATCSGDAVCRSGLCSKGTCQDTCCSMIQSGECAGGACRFGAFPGRGFDTNYGPFCTTAGGTAGNDAYCGSNNGTCKSDSCLNSYCVDACRSASDCPGSYYCAYEVDTSSNVFTACVLGSPGPAAFGGTCSVDTDCASMFCDPTSKQCTDACFTNADCSKMSSWFCRPETLKLSNGGYASVLLCGL